MKKWFLVFLVIAIVALGSVYFFIPSTISMSSITPVKAFNSTVGKFLSNQEKINQSLQGIASRKDSTFTYKDLSFYISKFIYNGDEINISTGGDHITSHLMALEVTEGASIFYWSAEMEAGNNPVSRILNYYRAKKIKETMKAVVVQMAAYVDSNVNMYGIDVKEIELKDSILISTKVSTAAEPTVSEIYAVIKKLTDYATAQNAIATDPPMLNVKQEDDGHFEFMVGLPINKLITENTDFRIKRMPYQGKMFVTEVKGGPATIKKGLVELGNYLTDSKRSTPAIPFELMVTNRALETDTTKWITKLYYPVM
jgi:hypothetical protein